MCGGQGFIVYNVPASGGTPTTVGSWNLSQDTPAFGCTGTDGVKQVGWLERQQFNSAYTELAVDDNGVAATESPSGSVQDVGAPAASGYGAQTPAESSPLFQPGTDTLWYADANAKGQLYSVDTGMQGAAPTRESGTAIVDPTSGQAFQFSPDGKLLVNGETPGLAGGLLMNPDDSYAVSGDIGKFDVATKSQATSSGGYNSFRSVDQSTACLPQAFATDTSMLCDNETPNVYLVNFSPSFSSLQVKSLLPTGNGATDDSAVVSPNGKQFAFITDDNGSYVIYKDSVSGGEPTQVADISGILANYSQDFSGVVLLAWQ
jgi:hypothetical protein